jgi:hypothetical protein
MEAELCRSVAYEAVRRGARANVHELWAALEAVNDARPGLVIDISSGPAVWWAWWSCATQVIGVTPHAAVATAPAFGAGRLPEAVVELVGDPREQSTAMRVGDQVAGRPVDVLSIGDVGGEDALRAAFGLYSPMVRDSGLVIVRGIANRRVPGIGNFWRGLDAVGRKELIGSHDPIGYGVAEIHGKDRVSHA